MIYTNHYIFMLPNILYFYLAAILVSQVGFICVFFYCTPHIHTHAVKSFEFSVLFLYELFVLRGNYKRKNLFYFY